MVSPTQLSDKDLRNELKRLGFNPGPVTGSTRSVMEKKLKTLRKSNLPSVDNSRQSSRPSSSTSLAGKNADSGPPTSSKSNSKPSSSLRALSPESSSSKTSPVVLAAAKQSNKELETKPQSVFKRMQSDKELETTSKPVFKRTPTPPIPNLYSQMNFGPRRDLSFRGSLSSSREATNRDGEGMTSGSPTSEIKNFGNYAREKKVPPSKLTEISKWLVVIFGSFTVILAIAYLFTAHQKTMKKMNKLVFDTVLDTANFVYNYAIFPILLVALVLGTAFVVFVIYKKRRLAKEAYERKTMEIVDKIADRVRASGDRGVAEQHLRDILLPPTRCSSRDIEIWSSAVQFINTMDSRIRSESRLLDGVECNVWIWVNSTSVSHRWPSPIEKISPSTIPIQALSKCLKLRGLVDDSSEYDAEIKEEIYSKLRPIAPTHFSIHHEPNEPCVYMMFSELNHAKVAFDTFHMQWFRGNLISVRYVRDERYVERFPEAV